nr:lamin tail domain-containing protein [Deltaproteobacteria bacterium]
MRSTRWWKLVLAICAITACGDDGPSGSCEDGEMRACYSGPPGTEGVGTCATGIEICVDGQFPGICVGDVTPFIEHCDGADEDCSGVVDDVEGTGNPCTNADDCSGTTTCVGAAIRCVAPDRNACDVCGGVAVADLGGACAVENCSGELVCNLAGDLIITEVMPSPSGDQTNKEWFEVEVRTAVDLNQLELDRAGDTRGADVLSSVECLRVAPGDRLVFARSAVAADNGNLPAVTGTFSFTIVAGSVASPGDVLLRAGGVVVDAMSWTSTATSKALQLDLGTIDHLANDSETNLCNAVAVYDGPDLGTPGAANAVCPPLVGECLGADGFRRAIDPPAVGELVITEVMMSPSGDDNLQEWFEAEAKGDFDLNQLELDRVGDSSAANIITSTTCLRVVSGARVLFAKSADAQLNGGLATVDGLFTFALVAGSVATPADVRIAVAGTTIDAITWTSSSTAITLQLDPDSTTAVDNNDETNFCDAVATYGPNPDLGTPRLANAQCPPRAGECIDTITGLVRDVIPPTSTLVITEFLANPAPPLTVDGTDDTDKEWFE